MSFQKKGQQDEFRINFDSMPKATEWNIVKMIDYANRASMMGREVVIRVTKRLEKNVPRSWHDQEYKEEIERMERDYSYERSRCGGENGVNMQKLAEADETYEENRFYALINLLDRLNKFPQKSQTSDSRPAEAFNNDSV